MFVVKSNPLDFKFWLRIGLGTGDAKMLSNEYQNTSIYDDPLKVDDHGKPLKDNNLRLDPRNVRTLYTHLLNAGQISLSYMKCCG